MPSIVTRNLQPSVDAFSGDLDQMNLSNHPPSGNMTPKGSSSSSFTTSSNVPPLLSQSSVSNIPFSTTANAPYSAYLTGNAMNSSSHGSAHGSVGGISVSGSAAGGGGGGVRSQGSIPMMGFKQDNSDATRYDDPMRAQGEGMRRGWNDDETETETESEMDYGPTNGAAGDTHSLTHSLIHSIFIAFFASPIISPIASLLAFSLNLYYHVLFAILLSLCYSSFTSLFCSLLGYQFLLLSSFLFLSCYWVPITQYSQLIIYYSLSAMQCDAM
jgi:hypothetical protein